MMGDSNEAINELMPIQKKKEIKYATTTALLFYHKACTSTDREAIQTLKQLENEQRRLASDKSYVLLAYFFLFLDDAKRGLDYL